MGLPSIDAIIPWAVLVAVTAIGTMLMVNLFQDTGGSSPRPPGPRR